MGLKINQQVINGATLLGTSLTMFGIGTLVPDLFGKLVMFSGWAVFLVFSIIAFFEKDKKKKLNSKKRVRKKLKNSLISQ